MKRRTKSPEVRFWAKVEKTESCWIWVPSKKTGTYGKIKIDGKTVRVTRYSYELHFGPLSDPKLFVCHHCDNPACVNPSHLFLGTTDENMKDCKNKGRQAYGEKNGQHLLSESDIITILDGHTNGTPRLELARLLNVSYQAIYDITTGRRWKHLTSGKLCS